jgi:hypothetical protein
MEHEQATAEQLAERYFLGELSDAEAEAFEEHYFDCVRCAAYVREELALLESGRDVARAALAEKAAAAARPENANVVSIKLRRRTPVWIPAAAAAVLVVAIAAPLLLRERRPASVEIARTVSVRFDGERGAVDARPLSFPTGKLNLLDVDVPENDYPNVQIGVREMKSKKLVDAWRHVSDEERSEPVLLQLRDLPAGSYEVAVEGIGADGKRAPLAAKTFEVLK